MLLAGIVGFLIYWILVWLLSRWGKRASYQIRGLRFRIDLLRAPMRVFLPIVSLLFISPLLEISDQFKDPLNHFLTLVMICAVAWLLIRVLALLREMLLSRYQVNVKDNLKARQVYTQIHVIERILTVMISLLAFAVILMTFEKVRQLGVSMLASAGILSIILGFAAQKSLGTLLAGIQIAITQPIRIDDVVIVEGEWGWIEEINLTFVVVKIWDLRRLVLPITYFIDTPFQNWTRNNAAILGTVYIYADYKISVNKIREAFQEMIQESKFWDNKVANVQVTNTNEQTLEIRALMSAEDSPTAWNLRCEMREKLIAYLQKNYPESLPKTRVELNQGILSDNSGNA